MPFRCGGTDNQIPGANSASIVARSKSDPSQSRILGASPIGATSRALPTLEERSGAIGRCFTSNHAGALLSPRGTSVRDHAATARTSMVSLRRPGDRLGHSPTLRNGEESWLRLANTEMVSATRFRAATGHRYKAVACCWHGEVKGSRGSLNNAGAGVLGSGPESPDPQSERLREEEERNLLIWDDASHAEDSRLRDVSSTDGGPSHRIAQWHGPAKRGTWRNSCGDNSGLWLP
jgi:hypothetical protein